MKLFRLHFAFCFLLLAVLSAPAQFVLHLSPVSPGSAQLQFMRASSYYYLLEESADLKAGFTAASGWMLGDDGLVTWPIHYNVSPPSSGGSGGTVLVDTFALYPFNNGKTLVTWSDIAGTMYRVLVVQDYSTLPPLVSLPGSATVSSLLLLVGDLAWNFSYETLDPALLPQEQQSVLAHLTSRRAEILAAVSGSNSGQGVYVASQKHFFRIQRVESDADGDGLDWAMETFILGTNPDEVDSDGDGYEDSIEIARGTDPTDPFDGIAPVITVVDGDGQLAWVGQFDDSPIIVRVANAEGRAIPNHKVVFSAPIAAFAANNLPTTAVSATYEAVTDDTGYAYVFFRQPGTKRTTTSIHAQVRGKAHNSTASVDLWTYAVGGNASICAAPQNFGGEWIEGVQTEVEAYELTWVDASNNEVDFVIEKSIGDENHWIPVDVAPANSTSWRDYDLDLGHEVYYRVNSVGL